MRWCFLTLFYSGLSPKMPGTIGSLFALILGVGIVKYDVEMILLLAILIGIIAIRQIDIYERLGGEHDNKAIVIDELVGQWLALGIACSLYFDYLCVFLSFVFFRIFDIYKPSLIGWVDRNVKGGLGVVGDDVLAGVFSGICVLALFRIFHWLNLDLYFDFFHLF